MHKRIIIIILAGFLSIVWLIKLDIPRVASSPGVNAGIMDLTHWNFDEKGIVSIVGEWEYYDSVFLTSEDFDENNIDLKDKLEYTVSMDERKDLSKRVGYRERGFGTFRATILVNKEKDYYGVKIKNKKNYTENALYINGEEFAFNESDNY